MNVSATRATYNVGEMATILDLSEDAVRKLLRAGKLPGRRIGGVWRVHRGAFDAWVETELGAEARSA
jgi:excisionase family DNA binding protein